MSTLSERLYKLAKAPAPFWAWEYAGRLLDLQPNAKMRAVVKKYQELGLLDGYSGDLEDLPGFPDRVEAHEPTDNHIFMRIHHKGKTYDFQGPVDDFVDFAEETHFASWPPGKTGEETQAKKRLAKRLNAASRKREKTQFAWFHIYFVRNPEDSTADLGHGGSVAMSTRDETPRARLSDPNYHALERQDSSDHFPLTFEQLTEQAYEKRKHAEQLVEQENQELSKYGMRWVLLFGIASRPGRP
jgi:hypothetical protein